MSAGTDARLGKVVGSYRLLSVLGAGSSSTVYLGEHLEEPHAHVAVKVLTLYDALPAAERASITQRFLLEAHTASRLRHDHILPVLSCGESDGMTYIVMPVIAGGTLATLLAGRDEPLPLDEVATFLNQLAGALDYAHDRGVIHRDVKPSNVLLDEQQHVYLTDFGIARLFESGANALTRFGEPGAAGLTLPGEVLGTPYYMAPEQIKSGPLGPATDIYELGVVLYVMVTGRVPFDGESPLAVAVQQLQETPQPPSALRADLPPGADAAILRALAKEPDDRFASARAMAKAFEAGIGGQSHHRAAVPEETTSAVSPRPRLGAAPGSAAVGSRVTPSTSAYGSLWSEAAYRKLLGTTVGPYRLEQLLEVSELGPVFLAIGEADEADEARYRLRILAVRKGAASKTRSLYLGRFQQEMHGVSSLRHPHILPLVDHGSHHGQPYLVSPQVTGPALGTMLENAQPLDTLTVGGYLDQIAEALEHAHRQNVLHRNLTADCVFLQETGEVVVADFGARRMLELSGPVTRPSALYFTSEAWSPEQVLGMPVNTCTDVYALGALLFHLLTGHPPFTGESREELAEQHAQAPVPLLRTWRAGLPVGLDRVLESALAKEPEQRFDHPNELARAYRQVVSPSSVSGRRVVSTASAAAQAVSLQDVASAAPSSAVAATPAAHRSEVASSPPLALPSAPPAHSAPRRARAGLGDPRVRYGLAAGVLVLAILASTFAVLHGRGGIVPPSGQGQVLFLDSNGSTGTTDAVKIQATGLAAPPVGSQYKAWLIDTGSERETALGTLALSNGVYSLSFGVNGQAGQHGPNLLAAGNRFEITLEQNAVQVPTSTPVLVAQFPPDAFVHIKHLLVAFQTTPGQIGLLVGLLHQSQLLNAQALLLANLAPTHDRTSVQCLAQSIVDIDEGSQGKHYQPLSSACASANVKATGDGYGLIGSNGYVAGVIDHARLAAQAPDATQNIKTHAGHVEIAATNIQGWVNTVDQDAINLINNPGDTSKVQEIATLSDHALNGVDTNGDEHVDPVPGEAGATTAYEHGQLLADLDLVAGR